MNLLFLTLLDFSSLDEKNIYTDLLREFVKNGHKVCVISPVERKKMQSTHIIKDNNIEILKLKIGNIQKTNSIEKGISTLLIGTQFKNGIRQYFSNIKFDLILYSTPPITFVTAIEYIKKRDNAKTYLLLKDIFPQNAVDIGMLPKRGLKSFIYRYFRRQEQRLYHLSNWIGCMSNANVQFVLKNNPDIKSDNIEVCPNSVDITDESVDKKLRKEIRQKYDIPLNKKVFIYGGNLGKPQGIPFLIECIQKCKDIKNAFFLIIGDGTEYHLLEKYLTDTKQENLKLMKKLPKADYDMMVGACDVGLIFLDHRFTIPNFPSRILSYMQAKVPVLAVTDPNTDVGEIVEKGNFGYWCESNDADDFVKKINLLLNADRETMGANAFYYLKKHYSTEISYKIIMKHMKK